MRRVGDVGGRLAVRLERDGESENVGLGLRVPSRAAGAVDWRVEDGADGAECGHSGRDIECRVYGRRGLAEGRLQRYDGRHNDLQLPFQRDTHLDLQKVDSAK